ncbi:MAG: amidohydrolase family protein [Planctomycetota bacterium]|nr:amidohydrolase family protein [Planctomycetota bacterium]
MRFKKQKLPVTGYVSPVVLFPVLLVLLALGLVNGDESAKKTVKQTNRDDGLPKVKHMIDTHIHLYDPTREKGVPWPPEDDQILYKPHLPKEFRQVSQKAGVTGVVIVEASGRIEDNRWVLDLVKGDDYFIGLVGNVDPYREDFGKQIRKIAKDKRLVGIRARVDDKKIDYRDPKVLKSFKVLSKRNLALDILMNGEGYETVTEISRLAKKLPELRIVVNHVLGYDIDGKLPPSQWIKAVKELGTHQNVYVKVSGLYQRCVAQPATQDLKHYRELLDILWDCFGEDRLIYGSNWPCTKKSGDYTSFAKLVNEYFSAKGQPACEKYFWQNATRAYQLGLK